MLGCGHIKQLSKKDTAIPSRGYLDAARNVKAETDIAGGF